MDDIFTIQLWVRIEQIDIIFAYNNIQSIHENSNKCFEICGGSFEFLGDLVDDDSVTDGARQCRENEFHDELVVRSNSARFQRHHKKTICNVCLF